MSKQAKRQGLFEMKSFFNWLEQQGISLWLDDERDPRDETIQIRFGANGDEQWVKTANEAIGILKAGKASHVSLDHDLGLPEAGTGYDVAKWIEEQAYLGELPRLGWRIHTQNPIGKSNMEQALKNADKYWSI
jgi:hypothetical protein